MDRIGAPKELIHEITRKKKSEMKNDRCQMIDVKSVFLLVGSQRPQTRPKFLLFLFFQHSLRLWLLVVQIALDRVQDSIDKLSGFVGGKAAGNF